MDFLDPTDAPASAHRPRGVTYREAHLHGNDRDSEAMTSLEVVEINPSRRAQPHGAVRSGTGVIGLGRNTLANFVAPAACVRVH